MNKQKSKSTKKFPPWPDPSGNQRIVGYQCFVHSSVNDDGDNRTMAWIFLWTTGKANLGRIDFYGDKDTLPLPSIDPQKGYRLTYYIKQLPAVLALLQTRRAILGFDTPSNVTLSAKVEFK